MSEIIELGCRVADVHHRYHAIHNALFGAASFRLIIDALRGRRRRAYREFARSLKELQFELVALGAEISDLSGQPLVKAADRELREQLSAYTFALSEAIVGLDVILVNLERDESGYREPGGDGRSGFTRDKAHYDHRLLELERLGSRLNRLFANY